MTHIQSIGGFDARQHAYRPSHSCETAVTEVLNFTFSAANSGQVTLLALLDLSAAFDTVDHEILKMKLSSLGVVGKAHSWLAQYLSGRRQSVLIRATLSDSLVLPFGVPQGSVLGPLLFIIYLRGIDVIFKKHNVDYVIYADDIQVMVSAHPTELAMAKTRIVQCILKVKSWLHDHKPKMNDDKTEIILLGNRRLLRRCTLSSVVIEQCELQIAKCVRDLGVWLDDDLSFDTHVIKVCAAAFAYLRVIGRLWRSLTERHRLILIHAFVISRVRYCCSIYNGVTKSNLNSLQRVLNAALRLTTGKRKHQSLNLDRTRLNFPDVHALVRLHTACLVRAVLSSGFPLYLRTLLAFHEPVRNLRSSNARLLQLSPVQSAIGMRAFASYAPRIWNSLPQECRQSMDLNAFKRLISISGSD